MSKIINGRQLLEWLQKQPDEVLDGKLMILGEDRPVETCLGISVSKEDYYKDEDGYVWEESDARAECSKEEFDEIFKKVYDKGGISIFI